MHTCSRIAGFSLQNNTKMQQNIKLHFSIPLFHEIIIITTLNYEK